MQTGARTPVLGPWDLATSLVGLGDLCGTWLLLWGDLVTKMGLGYFEFDEDIDRTRR